MLKQLIMILCLSSLLLPTMSVHAASALEKEISNDLKQFSGQTGVFAKNLKTGKTIKYNQDQVFPTASTSKLVVALGAYKYLYPLVDAAKRTEYDQDIDVMIKVSDNTAFEALLDEADAMKKDAFLRVEKDLGLKKTKIHDEGAFASYGYHSITTPYEMSRVMETIYNEKYLKREQVRQLKDDLSNTIFQDEIPRYMQTPVFHKVGELDDVLCDVGVIQDGRDPILISFYTRTADHEYSSDFIAKTSAKLYNALRRR